jgi:hypothetical protein
MSSTRIHREFIIRCYHARFRSMTEHNSTEGENPQVGSISTLGILAASLAMRLTPDELEWLYRELEKRAEEKRREAGGEVPVLAGYRDVWEPVR